MNGTVKCFGADTLGESTVPADAATGAIAVAAGRNWTCAVRFDGRIHCWGDNSNSQLAVPESLQYAMARTCAGSSVSPTPSPTATRSSTPTATFTPGAFVANAEELARCSTAMPPGVPFTLLNGTYGRLTGAVLNATARARVLPPSSRVCAFDGAGFAVGNSSQHVLGIDLGDVSLWNGTLTVTVTSANLTSPAEVVALIGTGCPASGAASFQCATDYYDLPSDHMYFTERALPSSLLYVVVTVVDADVPASEWGSCGRGEGVGEGQASRPRLCRL